MLLNWFSTVPSESPSMANTPAFTLPADPPRSGTAGRPVPAPPNVLSSVPNEAGHEMSVVPGLCQSATHSHTLPTMSRVPHPDTQLEREPVATAAAPRMLQSLVPLSAPVSGVLAAAYCHSAFVRSRLPDAAHACAAWNHDAHVLGGTPATETA